VWFKLEEYMKKIIQFAFLIFIIFNLSACAQQEKKGNMTVKELNEKFKKDTSIVLLDVRTEEELTGPLGHIEGIIHIPLQEIQARMHELDKYKDKEIAVICRSGNRSGTATAILKAGGFNAVNVEGGMMEYRKEGLK
jgi:rhodanese-related sulfurtransferase